MTPDLHDLSDRYDLYGPVHKGLRLTLSNLLVRLGSADFRPGPDADALIADFRAYLALGAAHLAHEEAFVHRALEARLPKAAERLECQHRGHALHFAELETLVRAIEAATPEHRAARGKDLYLAFSRFVAEDLTHMHEEETVTRPTLCALFTDAEQQALEGAIIASLSPDENLAFMRMMLPAMTPAERLGLMRGMQAAAPPEAVSAVLEFAARPTLASEDFRALTDGLQHAD